MKAPLEPAVAIHCPLGRWPRSGDGLGKSHLGGESWFLGWFIWSKRTPARCHASANSGVPASGDNKQCAV